MRYIWVLLIVALFFSCAKQEVKMVDPVPYVNWESSSVQANGIRLHYWRTGSTDKPVLIMVHGITDYGLNYARLAARFENEYDVIMYDARGHGFSEKPEGPYTLDAYVADLVGLVDALGITKPILMGHSMGGSIVMKTAALYSDLPSAVIMEDPPMEEALERLTEDILDDWKGWVKSLALTPKPVLMKNAKNEYHPGWDDFLYDHWAESKLLVSPKVIDILKGEGFGHPRELLPNITAPAIILKAEAENEEYKQRHLEAAALLPNGKLVHFEGAGHLIRNDKPQELEKVMKNFLSQLSH